MQNTNYLQQISTLNPEQLQAVEQIDWPVMVVAGPWTWKTQIIALRTANILQKAQVNPWNILITTFTEAWVIAIKKRLWDFLWANWYKVYVSTIHSFCQDVISTFSEKFLEYKAWTPIDDVDSLEILKNILDNLISEKKLVTLTNDFDKYLYLRDIKSRIWNLKQEWINVQKLTLLIKEQSQKYAEELSEIKPTLKKYETTKQTQEKHILKLQELALVYEEYNNFLRNNSKYDFSDMINFVLEKFKNDEELRYFYAEKFQYIMLDEFQDTNNAQNEIIDLILSVNQDKPNIMVVWDDDQSIYRFQWANIENMLDFSTKYQDTKVIVLKNNYRSTQNILDLCTNLIDNNEQRLSKKIPWLQKVLVSSNPKFNTLTNSVKFFTPNTLELEKAYLLQEITKKIDDWVSKSEIAIIVRSNKEVEELSYFFEQNKIDVVSKQNTDILKNEYVIFILKFLKCLKDPYFKDEFFIDICRNSILWLNQIDIFKINRYLYNKNYTKKFKVSFFDNLLELENISDLELSTKDEIIDFRQRFLSLEQKLEELNFIEFFNYFLESFNILTYIEKNWTFDDIEDIYTLFNKIKDFTKIDKEFNLTKFLSKIELYQTYNYSIARQILKSQKDWINILTSHSSKGLEYEVVFVSGLYTWNWDNKRVIDKLKLPVWIAWNWLQNEVDPIEEERRLFFVACSRAKKELYLSFPLSIDAKVKLASVFISEIKWNIEELTLESQKLNEVLNVWILSELKPKLYKYENAEFDYIKEFFESYKLSPTDLNVFLEDPKKFLNNVIFKYPFVDNEATIFWKVYHRVLELFYSRYKENKKLDDESYLTFTFKVLLEKEVLTPDSFEKLLEKWITWLKGFYELYKNNHRQVLATEYNFRPKWLSFNWVPLTWKIDKIELLWDFSSSSENLWQMAFFKESVALVDYKTWRVKSIWEIKWIDKFWNKKAWEWNYFRQLMFYKLLCELDYEFSSKYDIWSLALDFVEWKEGNYKYIEVDYTSEDYEYFKEELVQSWAKMTDINFWKELLQN